MRVKMGSLEVGEIVVSVSEDMTKKKVSEKTRMSKQEKLVLNVARQSSCRRRVLGY